MKPIVIGKVVEINALDFLEETSNLHDIDGLRFPEGFGTYDVIACVSKREENVIYFAFTYNENYGSDNNDKESVIKDLWKVALMNEFYEALRRDLVDFAKKEGKELSPLYGPGYYNMPISETDNILRKAGGSSIGLSVNEHFVMTPAFSRCGIFVLEDKLQNEKIIECRYCKGNEQGCSLCNIFNLR